MWTLSPVLSTIISFFVYTKLQGHQLTPAKAFTALAVLSELRFALNTLPDVLVSGLQSLVSLRRIQAYLETPDVDLPPLGPENGTPEIVAIRDATITWPSATQRETGSPQMGTFTPRRSFLLSDFNIDFPVGRLSLICGPLGSGKTLLLLALLGEADVLSGQVLCPRSSPDAIASYEDEDAAHATADHWLTRQCAYVPQSSWLQNATVRENVRCAQAHLLSPKKSTDPIRLALSGRAL